MAKTYVDRVGDGQTQVFTFDFSYIARPHIVVEVNGVSKPFTWSSDFTVSVSPAPPNGSVVRIKRSTPTAPYIDYNDAATLTADELDTALSQPLYAVEELVENFNPFGTGDGALELPDLNDLHITYANALGEQPSQTDPSGTEEFDFLADYKG